MCLQGPCVEIKHQKCKGEYVEHTSEEETFLSP